MNIHAAHLSHTAFDAPPVRAFAMRSPAPPLMHPGPGATSALMLFAKGALHGVKLVIAGGTARR